MEVIKYQGKYITATEEVIDGHTYERVRLREGVHLIPYREEDNKILLMKEYRVHEGGARWKFVSGWIDKEGKDALQHAKEELAEELGLEAEYWKEIFSEKNRQATCSTGIHVFLCEHIHPLEQKPDNPDTGEVLDSKWFSLDELIQLIEEGNIKNPAPFLAALVFLLKKQER